MSKAKINPNALSDEELHHLAGGSIPIAEINLPLDELNALKNTDRKLLKEFAGRDLTKDIFWNEMAPRMTPKAISGLLKIMGREEWMARGGPEGISG